MWIVGIDVSKGELVVRLENEPGSVVKEGEFSNNAKGLDSLGSWLEKFGVEYSELRVCMESTNIYWEEAAEYFYAKGATVHVVNPMRTKGFGQSQMQRNKTDKVDAKVIVHFTRAFPDLREWESPSPEQRKLRALNRHRESILKTQTQHKNRLKVAKEPEVINLIEAVLSLLQEQLAQINKQISDLIKSNQDLKEKLELLTSIPGIGQKTAEIILAEMPDLEEYESARAAAADAGLTPSRHESGSSVKRRPKLSCIGKASIRRSLFLPALTALNRNPIIQKAAHRLEQQGKVRMVIVGAAMRRLIHIAYGVLKNRTPFDPHILAA